MNAFENFLIMNCQVQNLQNDVDSMGLDPGFAAVGLGVFDAFFTSLSMIIVSEVCVLTIDFVVIILVLKFSHSIDIYIFFSQINV